jgi:hypothetical protein
VSDFDSLLEDIEGIASSVTNYAGAATRHALASDRQIELLWADNAALRDDLHAVANRLESLTRAVAIRPGSDFVRRADDLRAVEE